MIRLGKAIYELEKLSFLVALEHRNNISFNKPKILNADVLKYLPVLKRAEEVFLYKLESCKKEKGCFVELDNIIGKILGQSIGVRNRTDLIKEKNDTWAIQHPDCLTYSRWERLSQLICDSLDIKVEITKKMCDLTYNLSKDIISCDVFAAVTTYNKACSLGIKAEKDEIQCKTDVSILKEKYPDCNLNARLYKKLIGCGMTYDIVETIVCKGGMDVYVKADEAYLKTPLGDINMNSDLQVGSIVTPEKCTSTLCKTGGTRDLSDREFLEILACDYNLNANEKSELFKTLIK